MKDSEDTNWENMVWCHRCGMVFLFSQIRYNCTNRPLWDQSGPSNIENLMRFNLLQWYLYATNAPNSGIAIISRTRNNSGEIIYTRTIVYCQNSLKNLVQVHVALRSRLSYVFRRRSSYIPFQIRERDSYFPTTLQVSTLSIQDILWKTGIDQAQEISKTYRRIFIGYCLCLGRHESWNIYNSHQIQCSFPSFGFPWKH